MRYVIGSLMMVHHSLEEPRPRLPLPPRPRPPRPRDEYGRSMFLLAAFKQASIVAFNTESQNKHEEQFVSPFSNGVLSFLNIYLKTYVKLTFIITISKRIITLWQLILSNVVSQSAHESSDTSILNIVSGNFKITLHLKLNLF